MKRVMNVSGVLGAGTGIAELLGLSCCLPGGLPECCPMHSKQAASRWPAHRQAAAKARSRLEAAGRRGRRPRDVGASEPFPSPPLSAHEHHRLT